MNAFLRAEIPLNAALKAKSFHINTTIKAHTHTQRRKEQARKTRQSIGFQLSSVNN